MNTAIVCLSVVLVSLTFPATGEDRDESCIETMTSCQPEREKLSAASQANNTLELCSALQVYSDCMGPRVEKCRGDAKRAFGVVIRTYVSGPYNCRLRDGMPSETTSEETKKQDTNAIIPSSHGPNGVDSAGVDEDVDNTKHPGQQAYDLDVVEPIPKHAETSRSNAEEATASTTATHAGPTRKPFDPSSNNRGSSPYQPTWQTVAVSFLGLLFIAHC